MSRQSADVQFVDAFASTFHLQSLLNNKIKLYKIEQNRNNKVNKLNLKNA